MAVKISYKAPTVKACIVCLLVFAIASILPCSGYHTGTGVVQRYAKGGNVPVVVKPGTNLLVGRFLVPKYHTGNIAVTVDCDKHTNWPQSNEEVQIMFIGTKSKYGPERSDDLSKESFNNVGEGWYDVYIRCLNESEDCDIGYTAEMRLTSLPTPAPTFSPTQAPIRLLRRNTTAKHLACTDPSFSRQATYIDPSSHEYCGCHRSDNICHWCCNDAEIDNGVERVQYDDLGSMPLYYGRWEYLYTGQISGETVFEHTFTQGVEQTSGETFTTEQSQTIEETNSVSTGFEYGVEASVTAGLGGWLEASVSVSAQWTKEQTSALTRSSTQLSSSAVSNTLATFTEESCAVTCDSDHPKHHQAHLYRWVVEKYDGSEKIKTCGYWCVYGTNKRPLCPVGKCASESCDFCEPGTFSHPDVDKAASAIIENSEEDDSPTSSEPEVVGEIQIDSSQFTKTLLAVVGAFVVVGAAVVLYRKKAKFEERHNAQPQSVVVKEP